MLSGYKAFRYTGIRAAKKLAKSLQEKFPDYHIWVEKYTSFEIDVAQDFEFTTLEDLHRRVMQLASVVDEGAGIGKEMLGDSFER